MNPNKQLPAMAAAETAIFVPASIRTNTTVYDRNGMAQKEFVTIESGWTSFGAISKILAKTDDTSRIRHIRTDEAPITLRQILDLAKLKDREIAILYDNEGKPPAGRYSYTRICLYSSSERSTLVGSAANKTQAAAHLVLPPELRGRYRFVAHTHPTYDPYKDQVNQDIRAAKGHVEMAVTYAGLIIYYSNSERILNRCDGDIICSNLKEELNQEYALTLDTPITESVVNNLDNIVRPVHAEIVTEEIDNCPLFGSSFQM